jgi:hypothetical protein
MWHGVHHGTGVTDRFTGIPGARFTGILTTDTIHTGTIIIMPIIVPGAITGTRITQITTTRVSELILRG